MSVPTSPSGIPGSVERLVVCVGDGPGLFEDFNLGSGEDLDTDPCVLFHRLKLLAGQFHGEDTT